MGKKRCDDVGHNSWWHMKRAQPAAYKPRLKEMGLFRHPGGGIWKDSWMDPATRLKVTTTLEEKQPPPTCYGEIWGRFKQIYIQLYRYLLQWCMQHDTILHRVIMTPTVYYLLGGLSVPSACNDELNAVQGSSSARVPREPRGHESLGYRGFHRKLRSRYR